MWDLPELPVYGQATNQMVCGWSLAILAIIGVGILLAGYAVFMKTIKSPLSMVAKVSTLLVVVFFYALAFTTPAFQYTMCKRALGV